MMADLASGSVPRLHKADICVVGAGPAGITLVRELLGSGVSLCLAEAGGLAAEADTQALYEGRSIGHPMQLEEGRWRVFGGSATRWGGRSATLDPIDLEARGWVPDSGWPISFAMLAAYYERAKQAGNFQEPWVDNAAAMRSVGRVLPVLEGADVAPFVWRFATPHARSGLRDRLRPGPRPSFDWARAHGQAFRRVPELAVLLHANLVALRPNAAGDGIAAARFVALNGCAAEVQAKAFVLCCSGIENARLLLNLDAALDRPLPGSGRLGRSFAQHPRGTILTLDADREQSLRLQRMVNKFPARGRASVQYELGFALTDAAQRRHRLLNASAGLCYTAAEGSSWLAGRRLRDGLRSGRGYPGAAADAARLALGLPDLAGNAWSKYVSGGQIRFPAGRIEAVVDLEQAPRADSRIALAADRDATGLRRVVVDWKLSEIERTTARHLAKALAGMFQQLRFGTARLAPWLTSDAPVREEDLRGNYHFIGSTRMARTPAEGVVDAECRVFGLSNLYLGGSSVFPTGGHANPTLTILALAIRLADHLKSEARKTSN